MIILKRFVVAMIALALVKSAYRHSLIGLRTLPIALKKGMKTLIRSTRKYGKDSVLKYCEKEVIPLNVSIEYGLKQAKYCLSNNLPMYAPMSGTCPNCRKCIYEDFERMAGGISRGYTEEVASNTHIKQCPHCMYIFEN